MRDGSLLPNDDSLNDDVVQDARVTLSATDCLLIVLDGLK